MASAENLPKEPTNIGSPGSFSCRVVPVEVTDRVRDQIDYLCKRIWENEWSGILFYTTQGKFGTADFRCILEDVFLMHVGSEVFTTYDFNADVVKYLKAHPHLHKCKIGHIHSHNFMGVFFSPEDEQELAVNCENHNIYLSVIVNNRGETIGRIAFAVTRTETTSVQYSFLDESGVPVQVTDTKPAISATEYYKCECAISGASSPVPEELQTRCTDLLHTAGQYERTSRRNGLAAAAGQLEEIPFDNTLELEFYDRANK
jgi:hypothetical protein